MKTFTSFFFIPLTLFILTIVSVPFYALAAKNSLRHISLLNTTISLPLPEPLQQTAAVLNTPEDTTQNPAPTPLQEAPATDPTAATADTGATENTTPAPVYYSPALVSDSSSGKTTVLPAKNSSTPLPTVVNTTTATSVGTTTFQGTGVSGTAASQNIYTSSRHLMPAVTRTLLELALVLAASGMVLVQGRNFRGVLTRVWG